MRFVESHPETERLRLVPLFKELAEIPRVVILHYALGRHLLRQFVKARPRGIARAAAGFVITRSPAFAREPHVVAGFLQQIRIRLESGRKDAAMRHRLLQLPRISSCEDRRATWAALRVG